MRVATLLPGVALLFAGCGGGGTGGESSLNDQELARVIENVAEARPEEEEERPPAPALSELRREEIERGVEPGAGCDFSENDRLLFVATAGDALARINGLATHFAASGAMGPSGGFFVTERFSISIGRVADAGVTSGETTSWPARLVLTDRRRADSGDVRIEGSWRCGA